MIPPLCLSRLWTCALVCKCFVIHRNPRAGSVIKTLIQEHREVQHKVCCWHSAEKYSHINPISRRSLCLPMCRQQCNLIKFQVPVDFAYSESWTLFYCRYKLKPNKNKVQKVQNTQPQAHWCHGRIGHMPVSLSLDLKYLYGLCNLG